MIEIRNPFRPTRFEHEQHPLIWISPDVSRLEGKKSAYVAGTRGSGKTSLLKAVNWRERLNNPTVRDQLGSDAPDYVAVYFRLPDYLASAIGLIDWTAAFPESPSAESIGHALFSQLIEFVAAQLICEALASLRAAGRFSYPFELEEAAVRSLLSRYPSLDIGRGLACRSLDDLSEVFRNAHQRLNVLMTRGMLRQALDQTLPVQPGFFINDLASSLRSLACSIEGVCSADFHVKICIDDCETLRPLQQRFLNTMVRNSRHPLFWVISFVSVDYDSTNTIQYNQTLSDADRAQLHLDEIDGKHFYRLCENVSRLRIYYSDASGSRPQLDQLPARYFNLRDLLGSLDVNQMLLEAAGNSLSSDLAALVERSRRSTLAPRQKPPPIYETYVLEKLGERLRDTREDNVDAYMRRKQIAALLSIFSEFRLSRIPYVGAQTITNMGDTCIRDYLELMGAIFEQAVARGEIRSVGDLQRREEPLSADTQLEGVRVSSRAKYDGIRNNFERDGAEAERAMEFIGKLTARLQSNHASTSTLSTPERGNFHFDLDTLGRGRMSSPDSKAFILRLLRRCEADGLLRPSRQGQIGQGHDEQDLTFRLHRRFASYFGFSHRGPYGVLQMPMEEFAEVCDASSDVQVDEAVGRAYARILRETPDDHPRLL